MYLDQNGLIEEGNGDGGDKLELEGFWFGGAFLNPNYPQIPGLAPYSVALADLTDATSNLERDEIKYTAIADPNDVSRDQTEPNIDTCGYYGYTSRVTIILKNLLSNWNCFNNGDFAWPDVWGRALRAYQKWYLYPLILLCDIWFMLSTIFTVAVTWFDWSDQYAGNDKNLISALAQAQNILPTPFSFIARKFFKYLRRGGPMHGLQVIFRPGIGANTEFVDLWAPTVGDF